MKIKLLTILVALPIFLTTNVTFGQTTLAAGDIAVFLNQADTPDDFAFVTFVDIAAGTGIYFTDCGSTTSGFIACTEGALKYVVPAAGLSAGDIVRFSASGDFSAYSDALITGTLSLATTGDQIIVFQDAASATGGTNASANPTFIFVINNASTLFTGNPPDSNETNLPPGLSDTGLPRTALGVGAGTGVDVEFDNTVYTGTYDFSGFATTAEAILAAKTAMTNPANYTGANLITTTAYANAVAAIPNSPAALNLMTLSNDEFLSNSFAVYPNPSNGNITIRNSGVALQNVTITDLNGRTMGTYEMNGVTGNADLSLNLNTGMYFMQLTSNDASTTKKLIIK
ncbi:T9SS type A sorting domain-containing protein [Kordia sp. YSTF-M3]|uniref:T9SS type A sorting domain-containing protein n=1 Tax=Kordia aestuariivivens TaxID=2759037 RepID=A0ABR7QFT5_9FLAO|nr:T9SS type A sorting domain-containing protein [Kordia aestuariivivens]MBC8757363.1 T9SS type A sorting domain-containing protein [Kordia aestuariivivens]